MSAKKNVWADIGKLFDPPKVEGQTEEPEEQPEPIEQKEKKAKKAIRRKHGKNSKV
jgi:hypothetical protein